VEFLSCSAVDDIFKSQLGQSHLRSQPATNWSYTSLVRFKHSAHFHAVVRLHPSHCRALVSLLIMMPQVPHDGTGVELEGTVLSFPFPMLGVDLELEIPFPPPFLLLVPWAEVESDGCWPLTMLGYVLVFRHRGIWSTLSLIKHTTLKFAWAKVSPWLAARLG